MTEDEAKKKACPLYSIVRFMTGSTLDWNPVEYDRCMGSACMMWRAEYEQQTVDCANRSFREKAKKDGWIFHSLVNPSDPLSVFVRPNGHGHCGLAGKP